MRISLALISITDQNIKRSPASVFNMYLMIVALLFSSYISAEDTAIDSTASTTISNTTASSTSTVALTAALTTTPNTVTVPKKLTLKPVHVSKLPVNCTVNKQCKDCMKAKVCYWCGSLETCVSNSRYNFLPTGCPKNKWYIKQCIVPGFILIIVVPALIGLLLLTCGCCIYCKCCRTSNHGWKKVEERITQKRLDRQAKAEERKAQRKEKTEALRMKYGLLKSDDEDPLI